MLISILQMGYTEVVELLLKTPGIDVNAVDHLGQAPLYWAASVSYNHIEHLQYICRQYINYIMLMFILQYRRPEVVELLLNTPGIDVNAKRNNGRTPLLRAANVSYNHIEHLQYICKQYINYFMLIFFLQLGHIEVVELLLKTPGIDINAVDQWGRTPLFRAANVSYNHIEHLQYICKQYINCFMFIFILQDGHDEIVRMLKAAGVRSRI